MFANSKNNGFSSKIVSKIARATRSRALVSAAVAATGLAMSVSTSFGLTSDITALTTHLTAGASSTVNNVSGYGASYSPFLSTNTYTMHYLGEDEAITSVTAGSLGTYNVSGQGVATVRRGSSGGNNDTVWYQGTGTGANHSTVTLDGPQVTGFNQAFNSNNLLMGADNVFSNMGNAVGNNTNVDRIDLVYNGSTGGIKAGASTAFSIFDRGPSTDHDAFDIAAITGYNPVTGQPTSYGPVYFYKDGTWGLSALVNSTQEDITRKNDSISNDNLHPSDSTAQAIGGILIQSNSLVPNNTTIYGYSLFAPTLSFTGNGSGAQLADWTNSSHYIPADSTSTGGGLDPAATLGALYTQSVPEPATGALAALAIGGFLARRPKRTLA